MPRLSSTLTHVLAIAGAAAKTPTRGAECYGLQAPSSMRWQLEDQRYEKADPSTFFYVNQDIDAKGNKANSVAQIVDFEPSPGRSSNCQLVFKLPEDPIDWDMIQREGPPVLTLNVFKILSEGKETGLRRDITPIGTVEIKPGTQEIGIDACFRGGSYIFEIAGNGRSRVAFGQVIGGRKGERSHGAFMGYDCLPANDDAMQEL